jgi:general secretion pathway protein D
MLLLVPDLGQAGVAALAISARAGVDGKAWSLVHTFSRDGITAAMYTPNVAKPACRARAYWLLLAICLLTASFLTGCASKQQETLPSKAPELTGAWGIGKRPREPRPAQDRAEFDLPGKREKAVRHLASSPEPPSLIRPGQTILETAKAKESDGHIINFKEAPLSEVIPVFAELLGIKVAVPPNLKGTVTLHSGGPLRADEVLPLLVTLLELNGYALVNNGGVFSVVPLNQAKYSAMLPRTTSDMRKSVAQPGFGIEVYYLTYLPANRALKSLRRFVSKSGDMASIDEANALVVAETGPNLAKIRHLIKLLDVPLSRRVAVQVYQVKNVEVKDLAKDLTSIFKAMGISQKPQTGVWADVVALPQLRSIAVISSVREMFERVEQWLADLDRQLTDAAVGVFVYHCQSGDAATIAEVLTSLYGETEQGGKSSRGKSRTSRTTTGGSTPTLGSNNQRRLARENRLRSPGEMDSGTTSQDLTSKVPEMLTPTGTALEEGVRVVVEPNTNALVIRSPRRKYEDLLRTIKRLDVFPRQVLIEVMIAEVQLDGEMELGVEWETKTSWNGRDLEGKQTWDAGLGLTPASGLVYTITQAGQLKATLRALATDGKLNVVSAPLLLSSENQESHINVGEELPIVTDITTSQDLTNPDTGTKITDRSIKYRDTGISLSVTPRINDSGLVKMQVVQEITDLLAETFGDTGSPSFFKRRATTNVITMDGQSIVIAGLIKNRMQEKEAGIPFLSQIPLLGYLFKTTQMVKQRTELVITLTPHVIHDMADARLILQELQEELQRLRKPFIGQVPVRTFKPDRDQSPAPQSSPKSEPAPPITSDPAPPATGTGTGS